MSEANLLVRELDVFARYLGAGPPEKVVADAYLRAHVEQPERYQAQGFDARLVALARRGAFATRIADAYARLRRPGSALRKKLVLTLALIESTAPGSQALDEPADVGLPRIVGEGLLTFFGAALALLVALLLLGPLELLSSTAQDVSE